MVGILHLLTICLLAGRFVASEVLTDSELLQIFSSIDEATSEDAAASVRTLSAARRKLENVNATDDLSESEGFLNRFKYVGSPQARLLSKYSTIALTASKLMLATDDAPDSENAVTRLLKYSAPAKYCPNISPYCEAKYPYRYPDGSCNNLEEPWWGKSETPYNRYLPPAYDDGVDEPRKRGERGYPLPNPRVVALNVHYPLSYDRDRDIEWSSLFVFFGQFIVHDMSLAGSTAENYNSDKPLACGCRSKSADCLKFAIPRGDHINDDSECMATPRSASSYSSFNCKLGYREQLNLITSWWDLNQVYGSTAETAEKLRVYRDGQLKVSRDNHGGVFLPQNGGSGNYFAGDVRSNENLMLQTLQILWMKEHNRVAYILKQINPYWNDEKLFQEARVIVIAEYQNVLHNEYIPQLIGWDAARDFDLIPFYNGDYFYGYDQYSYPAIYNEVGTAAMRCHSLVPAEFTKRTYDNKIVTVYDWRQWLLPSVGHQVNDGFNQMVRGCTWDPMGSIDGHVTEGLFNHIEDGIVQHGENAGPAYRGPGNTGDFYRLSLPAVNILRGRDHGLRSYNDYRRECGLKYAYSFKDLAGEMPYEDIAHLEQTYDSVNDIDLWTGGSVERPLKGAVAGPTFTCLIGKQFKALKFGDRFYYENGHDQATRLTLPQLNSIRKWTMAKLLCDNADVSYIQPDAFRLPLPGYNPLLNCDEIPAIDYNLWREAKPY